MKRVLMTCLLLGSLAVTASAQFYTSGDNQFGLKWKSTTSQDYKIIYPQGMDSLARTYVTELQKYAPLLAPSLGFRPNEKFRRPMPVVLDAFYGISNGSVSVAPLNMTLYTMPDAYGGEAIPWVKQLAIHEGRHAAQMQLGRAGVFKGFNWILGEMFVGAVADVYPGKQLLEGDAVVAETALTNSGRGRSADFLEYFNMAMDQGDFRNWYKWLYGSLKYYTPNHYLLGYQTIAGVRHFYDEPLFMKNYFSGVLSHPLRLGHMQHTVKEASGKKFKDTWTDLQHNYADMFREDASKREPFMTSSAILPDPKRYTSWSGITTLENDTYAVKSSLSLPATLVKISEGGKETHIRTVSSYTYRLAADPNLGRIYWSESVPSMRWSLLQTSRIVYYDSQRNLVVPLTAKSRLVNPSPSPDGMLIAAVDFPYEGGSRLVLIDAHSGRIKASLPAPDNLQLAEPVWLTSGVDGDGMIYVSALSDEGFGIYSVTPSLIGDFSCELHPSPAKIKQLTAYGNNGIAFCSDRTGVNEIYVLEDGKVSQLTSTRYGASDPAFVDGKLLFSEMRPEGHLPRKADISAQTVNYDDTYEWKIANTLSAQEEALSKEIEEEIATLSSPKDYSKVGHLLKVHSWAPLYFDYDEITHLSGDINSEIASLGITGFLQNNHGNAFGSVGVMMRNKMPSAHVKFTYSGLPIAFGVNFDIGDRKARYNGYHLYRYPYASQPDSSALYIGSSLKSNYYISGKLRAYAPLSFSSGGWSRGLIPEASLSLSNDIYTDSYDIFTFNSPDDDNPGFTRTGGRSSYLTYLNASVRYYCVQYTPPSRIYPRWGLGAEIGGRVFPGLSWGFSPSYYGYVYAYTPGLAPTHGFKFTLTTQANSNNKSIYGSNTVNCRPRGFVDSGLSAVTAAYCPVQTKFTVDYSIPFGPVGWTFLCPVAYVKNFEAIPFFDYTSLAFSNAYTFTRPTGNGVYSAGMALNARLGNFFWIPFETRFGVTAAINGGSSMNFLDLLGQAPGKYYIGLNFDISI